MSDGRILAIHGLDSVLEFLSWVVLLSKEFSFDMRALNCNQYAKLVIFLCIIMYDVSSKCLLLFVSYYYLSFFNERNFFTAAYET